MGRFTFVERHVFRSACPLHAWAGSCICCQLQQASARKRPFSVEGWRSACPCLRGQALQTLAQLLWRVKI